MNAPWIVAALLVLAVLAGAWRTRRALRIALQALVALLLYACLFPPSLREDFAADELVVLTPGATGAQRAALPSAIAASVVALPGTDAGRDVEHVPDLGTALRRHAEARRLRIVGGGLPARDRDAARGLVAAFDAAPLPRGLVELDAPASVLAGHAWRIGGRVEGMADGRVELRDPSGATVAGSALDAHGRFVLAATAKGEGAALFALAVLDREGARVDAADVPIAARAGASSNVLLLAGAPDPELKYLRRWIVDAGLVLDSRIALTDGVALNEGRFAFDADALRHADLAILDERSWAALNLQQKALLQDAVREGLGLFLRVTGPVPPAVAADWSALGFQVSASDPAPAVALDHALGLADSSFAFARQPLAVEASDAAPLLLADDGTVLAWQRNVEQGRVALWLLADSYTLVLGGASASFGSLWSDAFANVSRARGENAPTLPHASRVDERAVLCGLAPDASVESEDGRRTALVVDADGCAGFWPQASGWHALSSGNARWPFFVRDRDTSSSLAAAQTLRETRALVGASTSSAATSTRERSLPRWPFFLALLVAASVLWWSERGAGRAIGVTARG